MKKNLTKALRTLALLLMLLFIIISPSFAEETVTFSTSGIDYGWFKGWFPESDKVVAIVDERYPLYGRLKYLHEVGDDTVDIDYTGNYGAIYHGVYYNMWDTEFDEDQNGGGFYKVTSMSPNHMGMTANLFSVNTNGDDYKVWDDRSKYCSTTYNIHLDVPRVYYMYTYSSFDYEYHVNVDGTPVYEPLKSYTKEDIQEFFDLSEFNYDPNKTLYTRREFNDLVNKLIEYYQKQGIEINKYAFLENLYNMDDAELSILDEYGNYENGDIYEFRAESEIVSLVLKKAGDADTFDESPLALGEIAINELQRYVNYGIRNEIYDDGELLSIVSDLNELRSGKQCYELKFVVPAGDHEITIKHEINHITILPNSLKTAFAYEISTSPINLADFWGLPIATVNENNETIMVQPTGETDPFHLKELDEKDLKPKQYHHYASNKNKTYTPKFKEITDKYNLNLDDDWNIELLPHIGRHPNEYHEYVLENMMYFDEIAQGDKETFLQLYETMKSEIRSNPDMLYKKYWKEKQNELL